MFYKTGQHISFHLSSCLIRASFQNHIQPSEKGNGADQRGEQITDRFREKNLISGKNPGKYQAMNRAVFACPSAMKDCWQAVWKAFVIATAK